MQGHSPAKTIVFTNGVGNVAVGEKADLVISIGKDNPGHDILQTQIAALKADCEAKGLKYVILGDGKNEISASDIDILPRSNHLIVYAHGKIDKKTGLHTINLMTGKGDNTFEIITLLQKQTKCNKALVCACFGGKINDEIKSQGKVLAGTEIVTTSAPDEVSGLNEANFATTLFVSFIHQNKPAAKSLTEYFGLLMKTIPETMTYGKHTKKGFITFTIRRQDHAVLCENDPQKYFEFNKNKLDTFLRTNHLGTLQLPPMTADEADNYRTKSFLHHAWHCDFDAISKLIQLDKNIISKLSLSPLYHALCSHAAHLEMKKSADQIKKLVVLLIEHDPNGMLRYFKERDPSIDDMHTMLSHQSIINMLVEIADATIDPAVILPILKVIRLDFQKSSLALIANQEKLHKLQVLQDPRSWDMEFLMASTQHQYAVKMLRQITWVYAKADLVSGVRKDVLEKQIEAANAVLSNAASKVDQCMLQRDLHILQFDLNSTRGALHNQDQSRHYLDPQMPQKEYLDYLHLCSVNAQNLLFQATTHVTLAERFVTAQQQIFRARRVIPQQAQILLQQAQHQLALAQQLVQRTNIDLKMAIIENQEMPRQQQKKPVFVSAQDTQHSQPEKEILSARPPKNPRMQIVHLKDLVDRELKKIPGAIANMNNALKANDNLNAESNKIAAQKRIAKIRGYLIELEKLGSSKIDKFTKKLEYFAEQLESGNASTKHDRKSHP